MNNNTFRRNYNEKKLVKCKTCGAEIARDAEVCPNCGRKIKKPIYKRAWFIILVVLLIAVLFSIIFGGDSSDSEDQSTTSSSQVEERSPQIEYTAYSVGELMDDLSSNALRAEEKYLDQYVELTGKVNVIDSDGQYISIMPVEETYSIFDVHCNIITEEQKQAVMELSVGDTVIVKGKITEVGEVMGYFLDIDEISGVN